MSQRRRHRVFLARAKTAPKPLATPEQAERICWSCGHSVTPALFARRWLCPRCGAEINAMSKAE